MCRGKIVACPSLNPIVNPREYSTIFTVMNEREVGSCKNVSIPQE